MLFRSLLLHLLATVTFEEITPATASKILKDDCVSAIGHIDTSRVLSDILGTEIPMNRINISLKKGDSLIIAQLKGGRLPEGSTTLPEGFSFSFHKVTVG